MLALERHLGRGAGRAGAREVREDDRQLGLAREDAPAGLGLAVEALPLEGAEEERPLRTRQALVLDRVAERDHHRLHERVRREVRPRAPEGGVGRGGRLAVDLVDPFDRGGERDARGARVCNAAHELDVLLAVAAMSARQPARRGKAVAALPHPERSLGDAAPRGDLAYSEHLYMFAVQAYG